MASIIITRKELLASTELQEAIMRSLSCVPQVQVNDLLKFKEALESESKFYDAVMELQKIIANYTKAYEVQHLRTNDDGNSAIVLIAGIEYVIEEMKIFKRFVPTLSHVFNAVASAMMAVKSVLELFKPAAKQFAQELKEHEQKWLVKKPEEKAEK